ncbi:MULTISPECIES: hypothetical protein [Prochlorococcus]|nr:MULTISPECIES: hypothetical protein [Prochlorococcus]NMO83995.1 hypothetical protein [Prochlorococcus sp. P1344]NMP05156.1 hypothetical protein [Prochlorococcus sp. P1361]NMP12590.1 hypothetical protein [Prochlorococcus sp.P1363]
MAARAAAPCQAFRARVQPSGNGNQPAHQAEADVLQHRHACALLRGLLR